MELGSNSLFGIINKERIEYMETTLGRSLPVRACVKGPCVCVRYITQKRPINQIVGLFTNHHRIVSFRERFERLHVCASVGWP